MGLGDYSTDGIRDVPSVSLEPHYAPLGDTSILPRYAPIDGAPAFGEYFDSGVDGLGNLGARRPSNGTAWRLAATVSPAVSGLGEVADTLNDQKNGTVSGAVAGATVAVILLAVAARLGAGYIVGKAVAPSPEKEGAYSWGGALASVFGGSLGLGAVAVAALMSEE